MDKLTANMSELLIRVQEMHELLKRSDNDKLMERIQNLEKQTKELHIKFDAVSSLELPSTINPPNAPTTVRVAGAGRPANVSPLVTDIPAAGEEPPTPIVVGTNKNVKPFHTCADFFKHMWVTDKQSLYDKEITSQAEVEKIKTENKDKLEKAKNELLLQRSIAALIWKVLPDKKKDVVKSMMKQYENDLNKANDKQIILD